MVRWPSLTQKLSRGRPDDAKPKSPLRILEGYFDSDRGRIPQVLREWHIGPPAVREPLKPGPAAANSPKPEKVGIAPKTLRFFKITLHRRSLDRLNRFHSAVTESR
jgi:hypothetical protein